MEIPQYASQRAVVLPEGAVDVISLSASQPTSQITDPTTFYFLLLSNISLLFKGMTPFFKEANYYILQVRIFYMHYTQESLLRMKNGWLQLF